MFVKIIPLTYWRCKSIGSRFKFESKLHYLTILKYSRTECDYEWTDIAYATVTDSLIYGWLLHRKLIETFHIKVNIYIFLVIDKGEPAQATTFTFSTKYKNDF